MAGSLNKVILIGNLGADPEIKEMGDGTKMAKFSIATTEKYTNREGQPVSNTDWHNIVLWRRTAEIAEKYLQKGDSVCIEGKLKTRSWEDENGVKKYATDVQGDSMTMLGSKRETSSQRAKRKVFRPFASAGVSDSTGRGRPDTPQKQATPRL